MSEKEFRILGLQHFALGSRDSSEHLILWKDIFGLPGAGFIESEEENISETKLTLGKGSFRIDVDIMQPFDKNNDSHVSSPALHHVGLWVDDLNAAVDALMKKGVRFTSGGIQKGGRGHDIAFIHPKGSDAFPVSGGGVLIELVQAPPEIIEQFDREES